MNKSQIILYFLFLGIGTPALKAQVEDFQNWNSLSAEWEFHNNWKVSGEQEIRFVNNASRLGSYITVVGLQYKVNPNLSLGGAYRLTVNNDLEEETQLNHRFYADAALRFKPGRFTIAYRARYQIVFQRASKDVFSTFYPQHLRHKFSAKYNIRKTPLYPFAEIELYQSLNNPVENSIQKVRYTGGLGFPITNYFTIETYFRLYEKSYYLFKPKKDYILGFSFNFSF